MTFAKERLVSTLLLVPSLMLTSLFTSIFAFVGIRMLDAQRPDLVLPVISILATGVGLLWAAAPLLTGIALSETHDVSRLMQFPIPTTTLVASSLLANLAQPAVVAQFPLVMATAWAVAPDVAVLPFALLGVGATFAFILASAQVAGLAFQGIARNRRLHDLAMFFGLSLTLLISLVPLLAVLMIGSTGSVRGIAEDLLRADLFAASPFSWGVRAAVHVGRADGVGYLAGIAFQTFAIAATMLLAGAMIGRIHRGELSLAPARATRGGAARMWFDGPVGALIEKDLRMAWRDPGLKAALFTGFVGLLIFVLFITQMRGAWPGGRAVLLLASFVGLSAFGSNAFGFERRGVALLLGFPMPRWRLLAAKNLATLAFRIPGLLTVVIGTIVIGRVAYLPAAITIVAVTMLIVAALDNFNSILFPIAVPEPGKNPHAAVSGGRGFTAVLMSLLTFLVGGAMSVPFAFLAWLPLLLDRPVLWLATLPLALVGGAAIYAMLVVGASGLLERREPELIARILGEA